MSGAAEQNALLSLNELPFEIGYMHDSQACREGNFHWTKLPRNSFSFGKHIYKERYRHPFFVVRNQKSCELFIGQMGFSGGYEFVFHNTVDSHEKRASLSFECKVASHSPLYVLTSGEIMDTPIMHIAVLHGTLDDGIQQMNEHIRQYCSFYPKSQLIEAGIGPEVCMNEEMILQSMDVAAEIGAEVFFIDASWYSPDGGEYDWPAYTGDWEPSQWRYTRSMADFRAYAHERSMKFGVWMDVEKLGYKSQAFQDQTIPKLLNYDDTVTMDAQCRILDLADPDGLRWAFECISSVIERYDLDFFRLDSGSYSFLSAKETLLGKECRDLRYYQNLYNLISKLRRKYPDVIFQNCAGGGARLDVGMLRGMSNTWITDYQNAPRSFEILNGVSMLLPTEYFVRPFGAQNGHLSGTLDFQLNVVRFGNPLFFYNLPVGIQHSPLQMKRIKEMLTTYKEVIRPMLPNSRIYHHTPDLNPEASDCVGVLELASENGDCSLIGVFTLSEMTQPVQRLFFKGICASGLYKVSINDQFYMNISGDKLMNEGLKVDISMALDSKVILAQLIKNK